jgi:exosortase D (VPLPA-CTERM-specific)
MVDGEEVRPMSMTSAPEGSLRRLGEVATPGVFWLLVAVIGAAVFFQDGLNALLAAWQLPEYSHGPLIPILSALLFLRQLKEVPVNIGLVEDRWIGFAVILVALAFASVGKVANISDIVAYSLIVWIYGILLLSFGWRTGWHFWPPVLHLVYMLPLPNVLYFQISAWLQLISSELGVWFLRLLSVPVFLDGNIIDLGVYKLHVAEACSGLRYLFPILSFSYIFAVLYRGPMWHKAVLLISAAPITVLMNSVRIAIAGYIVNHYGIEWVEGFTHFFEGWVIFLICIVILFGLARLMLFLQPTKMSLANALDLETEGLLTQAARLRHVQPSPALILTALLMVVASAAWQLAPNKVSVIPDREPFVLFPRTLGEWEQVGPSQTLEESVANVLAATDYHSVNFSHPEDRAPVGLFMTWYKDYSSGGTHSPEVCLPGGGWEIAWLERTDISGELGFEHAVKINRAIIQRGEVRMMVYYWIEQQGRMLTGGFEANIWNIYDRSFSGRSDTGLVRLTTAILPEDGEQGAIARLNSLTREVLVPLHRFLPP